jgi:hypothetical protein
MSDWQRIQTSIPFANGEAYDRPILAQTASARTVEADMRNFNGFYNYQNSNGQAGAFASKVSYDQATDSYFVQNAATGEIGGTRYYPDGFQQITTNGTPGVLNSYTVSTTAQNTRNSLVANYSLLDTAQLCVGDRCAAGLYPGSNLQLTFSLTAGSVFSLGALLYVDGLGEGSVDFFNTAKMTGVTVSPGATLTSQSGTLAIREDGTFGYAAVVSTAAVPEPASWAMLIAGFGLVGASMRRRKVSVSFV